jgi:hypothetical protein
LERKHTSIETPEISIAFIETSSKSLSGVAMRNSGSQLFRLLKTKQMFNNKLANKKVKPGKL